MDIRAAEISSILKEQIANFGTEAQVSDESAREPPSIGISQRLSSCSTARMPQIVGAPGWRR